MYSDRFKTLSRAYSSAERTNKLYNDADSKRLLLQQRLDFLEGMAIQLKRIELQIATTESEWRKSVLSVLQAEIIDALSYVYPTDGYSVELSARVLRGKIHIEASVHSIFTERLPGRIQKTQGRLFQQVSSFGALVGVMLILGIKTLYIDEAFSGSSKRNVEKLNGLLVSMADRGFNLVLIAQDTAMANGLPATRLLLSRSVDNRTTIRQEVGVANGK